MILVVGATGLLGGRITRLLMSQTASECGIAVTPLEVGIQKIFGTPA